jgi:hypothetical protein
MPIVEVRVSACAASDTACSSPLATARADDQGEAALDVAASPFDGYLEISRDDMTTNVVFLSGHAPQAGVYELTVYTPASLGMTARLAGVALDPTRGVVRIETHDCGGAPAAQVSVGVSTRDALTHVAYFEGGGGALSTSASSTDDTGIAIAFGVREGSFGVHESLGRSNVGGAIAFARAGAVSSVVAMP